MKSWKYFSWQWKIFSPYETSACIDLIFALVTNFTVKATSVVELSLNKFFKRRYSSLFTIIRGYFTPRQNNKNREQERGQVRNRVKSFLLESALERCSGVHSLAIDITGNTKNWTFDTILPLGKTGILKKITNWEIYAIFVCILSYITSTMDKRCGNS